MANENIQWNKKEISLDHTWLYGDLLKVAKESDQKLTTAFIRKYIQDDLNQAVIVTVWRESFTDNKKRRDLVNDTAEVKEADDINIRLASVR